MKKLIAIIFFSVLTGCGEDAKSIEYYSQNIDEAKAVVTECKKSTSTQSENCKNAKEAVINDNYNKLIGKG